MANSALQIVEAIGDTLRDAKGREYVDLFTAHGTVFLGHRHPHVVRQVQSQLDAVWISGALDTPMREKAVRLLDAALPAGLRTAGLLTTGMEAAEFALRIATTLTGRPRAAAFDRSMHGKSFAMRQMTWSATDESLGTFVRLPFLPSISEGEALERCERSLKIGEVAALFIEPVQGSAGGWSASPAFYQRLRSLCTERGVLLVCDEILTGLHRLGPKFVMEEQGVRPDILLVGKALGNGFPASATAVREGIAIDRRMLPGSTFANNPLSAAAVAGVLEILETERVAEKVERIDRVIGEHARAFSGVTVRGRGALWFLEARDDTHAERLTRRVYEFGVAVSQAGRWLRLMPAATIGLENLDRACQAIRRACLEVEHEHRESETRPLGFVA